jgi:hypothetical protein
MRSMLVWLLVCNGVSFGVTMSPQAPLATADACRPAEVFVADDGSPLFEPQADVTLALNGAAVTGSTPVDGVFWSDGGQQITEERSREFHVCVVDEPTLHIAAEALRRQFNQEAVLTFDYLPPANAALITVPAIDFARFREAFAADSVAHRRLLGGSVTTTDHTLILVAGNGDLDIARRLVTEAGGDWAAATIAHGNREFAD